MKIISEIKNSKNLICLALPFILMDMLIRILAIGITYFDFKMLIPSILFNLIWILLIVGIAANLKHNAGRIVYVISFIVFYVLFLTNCIYYLYTGFFFSFSLVQMADQAKGYISEVIFNTNPLIFVLAAIILTIAIIAVLKFPEKEKSDFKQIGFICAGFIVIHLIIPCLMGSYHKELEWDNWRSPRNVYENFNDSNKSVKVCGFYEYSVRDFYISFLKGKEKDNEDELAFLNAVYEDVTTHEENEYTGMFEGKNVIFLQLEGLDSWLLNKEDTPHLYGLLENSIVFEDHYSYYNGGGSTFNSEIAVNTGFITPVSYNQNAYTFSSNLYEYSLPKLMKERGYSANAFHMNTGEYYSRELNYLNWGYDNYYGLLDENNYTDVSYELDRELILNESFYEKMFKQETPFMHYIISYTPHTPFSLESGMGKLIAKEYSVTDTKLTEEECARLFATETDYMVELLLDALEENGLLEDTIIVAFADHYLYTLNDKTILNQYKETGNNLINHTPFFIWSYDNEQLIVEKTNSQIDILPTVLNLLGIEYYEEFYIGNDILDDDYEGYAFFSDYSWYNGEVYVEDGQVVNDVPYDEAYINDRSKEINELIRKNDLTLKYDYFRRRED